jgi:hypothetical protein
LAKKLAKGVTEVFHTILDSRFWILDFVPRCQTLFGNAVVPATLLPH